MFMFLFTEEDSVRICTETKSTQCQNYSFSFEKTEKNASTFRFHTLMSYSVYILRLMPYRVQINSNTKHMMREFMLDRLQPKCGHGNQEHHSYQAGKFTQAPAATQKHALARKGTQALKRKSAGSPPRRAADKSLTLEGAVFTEKRPEINK